MCIRDSAYLLPITSVNGNYSPRVMRIRREGSTKRVTVGYLDLYGSCLLYTSRCV